MAECSARFAAELLPADHAGSRNYATPESLSACPHRGPMSSFNRASKGIARPIGATTTLARWARLRRVQDGDDGRLSQKRVALVDHERGACDNRRESPISAKGRHLNLRCRGPGVAFGLPPALVVASLSEDFTAAATHIHPGIAKSLFLLLLTGLARSSLMTSRLHHVSTKGPK